MKIKNVVSLCLIIVQLLFIVSCKKAPTEAPEINTKISGKITDGQNNAALAGVQITSTPVTSSVITGQDGNFTIPNITPGQYTLTASKDGYNTNTISVNVKEGQTVNADMQLIKQGPELNVSVNVLDFGTDLTSLTFAISNKTKVDVVTWQISSNQNWLSISPNSGTSTTESDIITVSVSRDNIDFGNYSAIITINSDYGTKQISVIMTKRNPNSAQITVTPTIVDFGSLDNNQIITVKNTGASILTWNSTPSANWIIVSKNSGTINAGSSTNVMVSVNKAGLQPNSYEGNISFSSDGGTQIVTVKMIVEQGTLNPPTLQVVGAPTKNSITLGWTATTDANFNNYKVFRSLSAGVNDYLTLVATISSASQNNFTDNNLYSNTSYYYKVYVYNKNGVGSGSNEISATTDKTLGSWVSTVTISSLSNTPSQGMKALADNNVWLVNDNEIWHYDGNSWTKNFTAVESYDFNSLFFLNTNLGWAVGGNGMIYKYNGITWTKVTSSVIGTSSIYSLVASSESDIWVSGIGEFFHFDGVNWTVYTVAASNIYSMSMVSPSEIYAVDYHGRLLKWNGIGWAEIAITTTYNGYSQVFAFSSNNIWLRSNKYLHNYNGNQLQLLNDDNSSIKCFDMVNSNEAWAADYKIYFYNGTNWKEVQNPINSSITCIEMLNSKSGWAIGAYGEILRYKE